MGVVDTEVARGRLRAGLEPHFGKMSVDNLKDEDVDEILQDLEGAMIGAEAPGGAAPPDTSDPRDGILTLIFDYKDKVVLPRVDRLGIMTEARLEAALGNIFGAINRARVQEYKRVELRIKEEAPNE